MNKVNKVKEEITSEDLYILTEAGQDICNIIQDKLHELSNMGYETSYILNLINGLVGGIVSNHLLWMKDIMKEDLYDKFSSEFVSSILAVASMDNVKQISIQSFSLN